MKDVNYSTKFHNRTFDIIKMSKRKNALLKILMKRLENTNYIKRLKRSNYESNKGRV